MVCGLPGIKYDDLVTFTWDECHSHTFVQTLESPGIKMSRFPGLESPGKKG